MARGGDTREDDGVPDGLRQISPQTIGEIGRMLASAEMLKHGLGVARPEQDTGFDLVSISRARACRVQVKTRAAPAGMTSETFSVRRSKTANGRRRTYDDGEVDVFVFVSLATNRFWVIPSGSLNLNAHKISLRGESPWRDAWHLLGDGDFDAS